MDIDRCCGVYSHPACTARIICRRARTQCSAEEGICKLIFIAGSSNGRTTVSGSVYLGSSPGPAAFTQKHIPSEGEGCVFV